MNTLIRWPIREISSVQDEMNKVFSDVFGRRWLTEEGGKGRRLAAAGRYRGAAGPLRRPRGAAGYEARGHQDNPRGQPARHPGGEDPDRGAAERGLPQARAGPRDLRAFVHADPSGQI